MATGLRVVTWNVLADAYIHRDWYPRTTDAELEPSGRRARLLDAVDALGADVLCLQEVEPPLFAALERRLSSGGLGGHFAQKGRGRPDGCATFVRRGLEARAPEVLRYADALGTEGHSGHLALLSLRRARRPRARRRQHPRPLGRARVAARKRRSGRGRPASWRGCSAVRARSTGGSSAATSTPPWAARRSRR